MPMTAYVHLGQAHDEYPEVAAALTDEGVATVLVHLHDLERTDWSRFAAVNLRMCRTFSQEDDFADRVKRLAALLERAPGGPVPFVNPIGLVPDGYDKSVYIPLLEKEGITTIPTRWIPCGTRTTLRQVMDANGWTDVVVKPAVASKSWGILRATATPGARIRGEQHHLLPGDGTTERLFAELLAERTVGVQPFLPGVLDAGETSYVFIGGTFSHAVRKEVAPQGWFAHEFFGGTTAASRPSADEVAWATEVFGIIQRRYGELTYGRVDALPGADGTPVLLECELVVPRLFLREGDALRLYARTIAALAHRTAHRRSLRHSPG